MIVMPVFREPPPAGSDSGLRPTQGQSRLWERIRFFPYPFVLRYAKIFAIAYSYGECIIKSGRHIF